MKQKTDSPPISFVGIKIMEKDSKKRFRKDLLLLLWIPIIVLLAPILIPVGIIILWRQQREEEQLGLRDGDLLVDY